MIHRLQRSSTALVCAALCVLGLLTSLPTHASPLPTREFRLDIARQTVTIDGQSHQKLTINGQLPGPVLHMTEGEQVVIQVTNHLSVPTAVHWHGLLLPGNMDGVPGFNGFPGIAPGETFTYRFPLRQSGTYWYHAHAALQEQDGLYGGIVVSPAGAPTGVKAVSPAAARDHVVLLSDFHADSGEHILHKLKSIPGYYNTGRRTLGSLFADARRDGWRATLADRRDWASMRMDPTDLADVTGYTFLINGRSPDENWTGLFQPGEPVRLRVINASAMSFFDFRIPGLRLQVAAADGRDVTPVTVDELRIAPAETYDLLVTPGNAPAYRVVAEPIDRTGFALGTLAIREGLRGPAPEPRQRAELTMADMGMAHGDHAGESNHDMGSMSMSHHDMAQHGMAPEAAPTQAPRGWADANLPPDHKALSYADLSSLRTQPDQRPPTRDIDIRLGGNMERYRWTINGRSSHDAEPIRLQFGERVRLRFINDTMMAHPMHLHGLFVQLENGQSPAHQPDKHTITVPPGGRYSALLTADEPGEWAFHCHLLYHMASGMMGKVVVATLNAPVPAEMPANAPMHAPAGGQHHAH